MTQKSEILQGLTKSQLLEITHRSRVRVLPSSLNKDGLVYELMTRLTKQEIVKLARSVSTDGRRRGPRPSPNAASSARPAAGSPKEPRQLEPDQGEKATLLSCFSALEFEFCAALERAGVDASGELAAIDTNSACRVIGKLIAEQDGSLLGELLPLLQLTPDLILPTERLSVRAAHTLENNAIQTVGQLAAMRIRDILALKHTGRKTVTELVELAVSLHLRLAAQPEASRRLKASISTVVEDQPSISPIRFDPALAALTAIVKGLAPWAGDARSAETLGDLFIVNPDLGDLPDELLDALRDLWSTPIGHLRIHDGGIQESVASLLEMLRDREGRLFAERNLSPNPPTLQKLAEREGLSRERVRQLCARAGTELLARIESPDLSLFRWRIDEIASTVRAGVPAGDALVESTLNRACRDLVRDREVEQLMLWAAGPYRVRDGWLMRDGSLIPRLPVGEEFLPVETSLSLDAIAAWVETHDFPAEAISQIMEQSAVRKFGDVWVCWSGTVLDKAEIVLNILNRPADSVEIVDRIGEGHTERSVRGRLFQDDRFLRVGKREWALATWGLEEYSGIAQEILERIERDGGSTPLEPLVHELVGTFGVSETSVRTYAEAPKFVLSDGYVRLRRSDEGHSVDQRVESVRGLFPDPARRLVHLTIQVDADVQRGSGMSTKEPVAAALGLGPGDRLTFVTDPKGSLLVSWPETGVQGPTLGSTRALAESAQAGDGDELLLTFDLEGKTACARRISEEDSDVASLTGLQADRGQEVSVLADSLGCRRSAVRSILARRGDRRVLDGLPREARKPGLDDALSSLADILAD